MGDASKEIEKQLMDAYDLKADVIKVGHHGSNPKFRTQLFSVIL